MSCESTRLKVKPFGTYNGTRLVYFPVLDRLRNISEVILYDLLSILWASLRVDIIYMLGYSSAPILIIPKFLRKKIFVNVDGLEAARPKFSPIVRLLYRAFEKLVTEIAEYIIVDSSSMGAYYRRNYRIDPVFIPNGGSCTNEVKPLGSETLKRYGLENNGYYLFIARLTPDNNIDLIIDGFKKTNSRKKLVVIGPLVKNTFVEALLANNDKRIIFLGGIYEPRLQRTLRYNSYAYVHGHQMGGTSVSLVEAMSCKSTIIALDTPCTREVAEDSAIYFERNAEEFKSRIEDLESTRLIAEPNEVAYALYKKKYSTDNTTDRFIELVKCASKSNPKHHSQLSKKHIQILRTIAIFLNG